MARLFQTFAIVIIGSCLGIWANPTLIPGTWVTITPPGLYDPSPHNPPFGCMDIHVLPSNPNVLYITNEPAGVLKSTDGGSTWTTMGAASLGSPASMGVMQIDPNNPLHMYYIGGVRGSSVGFWISNDGGNTWAQPAGFTAQANNSVGGWTNDVYEVAANPADFKHVLLSFHSPFEWSDRSGILESKDGGITWIRHYPVPMTGAGWTVWFLKKNGLWDGNTWLVGTQYDGYWRTADAGATWTKVSDVLMQHGGTSIFYSKTGVLYVGALNQVLRSTDDGLTFTKVCPSVGDGYYAIVGDGNYLYTQSGNTGYATVGTKKYYVSPENDGINWTTYNAQTFLDGPYRMAFDSANRIIYSSNWNGGVWALKVQGNAPTAIRNARMSSQKASSLLSTSLSKPQNGMVVMTGKSMTGSTVRFFDIRGRNIVGKR